MMDIYGAFYGVSTLKTARIPESCKYIGPYAFAGTSLTRVRIAADCEYSETSFPPGCIVERYGEDSDEQ